MKPTSRTLLKGLRCGDAESWNKLTELYHPFIAGQLRRLISIQDSDIDDIAQNVFVVLHARMPSFQHRGVGAFRAFLKEIVRRQALSWINRRKPEQLPQGFDGSQVKNNLNRWIEPGSKLSLEFEKQHHDHWQRVIMEEVQHRLGTAGQPARNFQIYRKVKLEQLPVATVATEFEVSTKTAYRAIIDTQRVVASVCQEWEYFID